MDQVERRCFLNPLYSLDLAWGTPYACDRMTELSSSFGGYHDVISSCVAQTGTDRERDFPSWMWRLLQLHESRAFPGEACRRQELILAGREWWQGSRSKMGTRPFAHRTERFGSHRSGRRHLVAPRLRFYDEYS